MTDHLTDARACLSRVDQAAAHFSAATWLTATCEHILDHLEAQKAAESLRRGLADIAAGRTVDLGTFAQPATAPSAAQQGDSGRDEAIARVHVDDYEPEVHTGERALELALIAADTYRRDFPGAVVGVSYNPRAAEEKRRETLARLGVTEQTKEDR